MGSYHRPVDVLDRVRQLLADEHTAGLAAVTADGMPWAANLYFALVPGPGLRLAVLTDPASTHAELWQQRSPVALTVFAHPDTPRDQVRGLQLRGLCQALDSAEVRAAYRSRFPDAPDTGGVQTYFVIDMHWARLVDRTAGIVEEVAVSPTAVQPGEP